MGKKIAVIAGGNIESYDTIKHLLADADKIVCADGGYAHAKKLGVTPDWLVGDFDSIDKIPEHIPTVPLSVDKNYTDSVFAVEKALTLGTPDPLLLIGMLGGRLDHTLSNLALLADCALKGYPTILTDGLTTVHPMIADGKLTRRTFPSLEGYYFSLLAYSPVCKNVTIHNGKYPLNNYSLTYRQARAVSNEFNKKDVTIDFTDGILFFITTPIK